MDLQEIQIWLKSVITNPQFNPQHIEGSQWKVIKDDGPLSRGERLEIYNYAYFKRLSDVLKSDFPGLSGRLGDQSWFEFAKRYLVAHPSKFHTINSVGVHLPAFIKNEEELISKFPFALDLARFEWALCESFYEEEGLVEHSNLASLPEDKMESAIFMISPAVRLVSSDWDIIQIRDDKESDWKQLKRPTFNLIFRKDWEVEYCEIDEQQSAFLTWLRQGRDLGTAISLLQTKFADSEAAPPIGQWFQDWQASGIINKVII